MKKKILAAETDGTELYLATEDYIYHGDFTGGSLSLHQHYHINTANATNVVLKFAKNRIVAGISFVAGTTPHAAVYSLPFSESHSSTHNISGITAITNTTTVPIGWTWSDIAEGRGAIYLSGYAGDKSAIFKVQPDAATGALGAAISVADIPRGETVTAEPDVVSRITSSLPGDTYV